MRDSARFDGMNMLISHLHQQVNEEPPLGSQGFWSRHSREFFRCIGHMVNFHWLHGMALPLRRIANVYVDYLEQRGPGSFGECHEGVDFKDC